MFKEALIVKLRTKMGCYGGEKFKPLKGQAGRPLLRVLPKSALWKCRKGHVWKAVERLRGENITKVGLHDISLNDPYTIGEVVTKS